MKRSKTLLCVALAFALAFSKGCSNESNDLANSNTVSPKNHRDQPSVELNNKRALEKPSAGEAAPVSTLSSAAKATAEIQITEEALPYLEAAVMLAEDDEVLILSLEWPAGYCAIQHRLEAGKIDASHSVTTTSGIRIAYLSTFQPVVDGTLIDVIDNGEEQGLLIQHPGLNLKEIVHSEERSEKMADLLGQGFVEYRKSALENEADQTQ